MIPLSDENPRSIAPIVTWSLVGANILVFIWEAITPTPLDRIVYRYGFIPALGLQNLIDLRVFTSMFLHIDITHIAGNMLYLWVFGDNVEDCCGHISFLIFYLLSGVAGSLTMYFLEPTSLIPAVGASGAISGILGGYILLFPRARIRTVVFALYFANFVRVPAFILIGFWFVLQLLYAMLGVMTGVAYWAHVGGFVAGLLLIIVFARRRYYVRR
jgi:membrane associated rhomboid family serine protease